jgi:integrase/recombinase XerD
METPKRNIVKKRNNKNIVSLREKKLSNGNISLYLDIYRNGNREYEFLKIYIKDKPKTHEEREKNKENLNLAEGIRSERESTLKHNEFGFSSPKLKKTNFITYYEQYIANYKKKDNRMIKNALKHFIDCIGKDYMPINELDSSVIMKYKDYLQEYFNGDTPSSYFKRFKKVIKQAVKDGLTIKNPAEDITCSETIGVKKEILSANEIIILANTECHNKEVKRAFLFCLSTGIRYCDVITLTYSQIDFENSIIRFEQSKVKNKSQAADSIIELNKSAIALIGERKKNEDLVFNLPSFRGCLNNLESWCKNAGITKNITWHSSRHSFATLLLMNGNDINTVSKLLGHSKLDHTMKYLHLVNGLKRKAVDSLPEINF